MKAEEPFECSHWIFPMCNVDKEPLPDIFFSSMIFNLVLALICIRDEAEEPFECSHWIFPMCNVDKEPLPDIFSSSIFNMVLAMICIRDERGIAV